MSHYKDLPKSEQKQWVKTILQRMADAYDVKKSALPQLLDINKNVVNNWGYYGRIPFDQLLICSETTGASLDWLIYGKESDNATDQDKAEMVSHIRRMMTKVLDDGVDYELVQEVNPNGINSMSQKFEKDLLNYFELPAKDKKKTRQ